MPKEPNTELLNPFPDRDGSRTDRDVRIRQRAYDLWVTEGTPEGREHEHWLKAEREIMMTEPDSSMGTPITPFEDIPQVRSPGAAMPGEKEGVASVTPSTSGAAKPAPDTSKSKVANRDVAGPRKAGTTPRPTRKPMV
jgi:hypothetical protein